MFLSSNANDIIKFCNVGTKINFVVQHQQGCHGTGHLDAHFPMLQGIKFQEKTRFNFVGNYQFSLHLSRGKGNIPHNGMKNITPGIIGRCDIAVWTAIRLSKDFCSN